MSAPGRIRTRDNLVPKTSALSPELRVHQVYCSIIVNASLNLRDYHLSDARNIYI